MSEQIVTRDPPDEEWLELRKDSFVQGSFMERMDTRMTVNEVTKKLPVTRTALHEAMERGELHYIVFPGSAKVYILEDQLQEWVESYCTR